MLNNFLGLLIVLCACVRLTIASLDNYNNGTVRINKCCEENEVLVNKACVSANGTGEYLKSYWCENIPMKMNFSMNFCW